MLLPDVFTSRTTPRPIEVLAIDPPGDRGPQVRWNHAGFSSPELDFELGGFRWIFAAEGT